MDALGKILHVKYLGYEHWFTSIMILQLKYHYISVDKARYAIFIVESY